MAVNPRRRPMVVLYERITDAIHDGAYPPGSTLPSEPKLAAELGVSRPALREALLLLQEDGLITVRRGVGRTVSDQPPRRGFEQLQPMERLLAAGGPPLRVRSLVHVIEEPTDFTTQYLLAPARSELRFWESLLLNEGVPCALGQEWAAPQDVVDQLHPAFGEALRAEPETPARTMLDVLTGLSRTVALTGTSMVSATLLGQHRGEQLGRPADTPVVLITQTVRLESTPLLAAKYLLPTGAPGLPVLQAR
ncbi:GntR family transcriptional regulator [Streptomyces gobiensis]|uniref:GntR family transcriptional regulator n=1 Tax=Streptomyces gobiensis TaxID=2875706 RepID=UPI001E318321|nr:GntR family transcriptional regulator [Streptomyces gobiensis]UGY91309.1 GntR family transcriptional regulator [Streptomyces gobiensis]